MLTSNTPLNRILIIDDHALFRSGLRLAIKSIPDTEVLEAASVDEALMVNAAPDLIVLDIQLNRHNSLARLDEIRRKWAAAQVLALSANDTQHDIDEAMRYGVDAFLSKSERTESIVLEIMTYLSVEPSSVRAPKLTPRQYEVLQLISKGYSNKAIGREINLSENTVRWHVQFILSAFHASSRSEAVFTARTSGLIE